MIFTTTYSFEQNMNVRPYYIVCLVVIIQLDLSNNSVVHKKNAKAVLKCKKICLFEEKPILQWLLKERNFPQTSFNDISALWKWYDPENLIYCNPNFREEKYLRTEAEFFL